MDIAPTTCTELLHMDAGYSTSVISNGQTPAEADLNLLETARRCELYGIRMTSAKDHEGVPLNLAVAHLGVLVFQNFTKINTFSWAKIRKLSFKRKRFLIKLHPEGYGYYKDTVEFFFEGRNECKNFWKKCIENHTFFRCTDAKAGMRQKPKIFSRGSSFRYSGRTQKQVSDFVRENYIKRQPFQRSTSLRTTPSSPSDVVGCSVSAQPLLPITASISCGSMEGAVEYLSSAKTQMSASEPTTPHVTQDAKSLTDRDVQEEKPVIEEKQSQVSSGLVSPDFDCEQEPLPSPDFLSQDTDDNISHDSYHVLEKEVCKTNGTAKTVREVNMINEVNEGVPSHVDLTKNPQYSSERNNNFLRHLKTNSEMSAEEHLGLYSTVEHTMNNKPKEIGGENDLCDNLLDEPASELSQNYVRSLEKKLIDIKHPCSDLDKNCGFLPCEVNSLPIGHSSSFVENDDSQVVCLDENTSQVSVNDMQSFSYNELNMSGLLSISKPCFLNHKRVPSEKTYSIAKELLMSERTYRRDLEILNVVFRDEFNKQGNMPSEAVEIILSVIDPLYEVHCLLLRELEQQMATWEGRSVKNAQKSDRNTEQILHDYSYMIKLYDAYIVKLPEMLELLFETLNSNQRFANFYLKFEMHKMCYLPLTSFLLRPLYRMFYYSSILLCLMQHYGTDYAKYKICEDTLNKFQETEIKNGTLVYSVVNYVKLAEVQRNLIGFENILKRDRVFIREGCLQKLSESGNQQNMFFLFSDILLYAVRSPAGQFHFKVQGQLPIQDLKVQPQDSLLAASHCFSVSGDGRTILLAASSEKEKLKWLDDLYDTVTSTSYKEMKNDYICQCSNNLPESEDHPEASNSENDEKSVSNIMNTAMHVCWHRNISIGRHDLMLAAKHSLSGYLLRKFKNNAGWQKLWVVLSNLCIFFYKSYLDDCPLANLPLAGYKLTVPSLDDSITKDYVFKLQYKSHSYFFQAENQHCFDRWMEVIRWSTLQGDEKTHL